MGDQYLSLTCDLAGGGTISFDVVDTTADDVIESFTIADYYNSVIGA